MAAGLGYIEFTTGDILTAAAANGYLASQVVMVFANAAARTAAITSPQEGMFSYLKDTNATEYYTGSAWAAIGGGGGGGKVLQVVNATYATETTSATSTYVDSGLTASITPSSSTSKILVIAFLDGQKENNSWMKARLVRGSTEIATMSTQAGYTGGGGALNFATVAITYQDSPATTSSTTYKVQFASASNNATVIAQAGTGRSSITLMEIGA